MKPMPKAVAEVRAETCARCETPCAEQKAALFHVAPCSQCPINRWGQYDECEQLQPSFGLGDAVAVVAQPIARTIDAVFGTKIANCGGCQKRREALNQIKL